MPRILSYAIEGSRLENVSKLEHQDPRVLVSRCTYKTVSSGSIHYYYSDKEPCIQFLTIDKPYQGRVSFSKKDGDKQFTVYIFQKRFYENIHVKPQRPVKFKPKRKLEIWEIQKNWGVLKPGMSKAEVEQVLGTPRKQSQYLTSMTYTYGELLGGTVTLQASDKNGVSSVTLRRWDEPFWYLLNKELFEEVKEKK